MTANATLADILGIHDQAWRNHAACHDMPTSLFFPYLGVYEKGEPAGSAAINDRKLLEQQALAVCAACPVRTDCRDHALETGTDSGIFGGFRFHHKADRTAARKERA